MITADTKLLDSTESKCYASTTTLNAVQGNAPLRVQQDFRHFCADELDLLRKGVARETWQSETLAISTHGDLCKVLVTLSQNPKLTRPQVREVLSTSFPSASTVGLDRSIYLALRLWLMINFQDRSFEALRHQAACIEWDDKSTLRSRVEALFPRPRRDITTSATRISPHFTASFLHRVCGLKVEWTTSIVDHLRVDHHNKSVRVFSYKHHMMNLLESSNANYRCPIPANVLEETLRSLDLLFPIWDHATVQLLKNDKQTFHEIPPFASESPAADLNDFYYWRDRLLELQGVLESPPVSWAQLWRGRRNPQQFWTFWIALIILVLTCFSCVASVVQAWASVQALNLALAQAAATTARH